MTVCARQQQMELNKNCALTRPGVALALIPWLLSCNISFHSLIVHPSLPVSGKNALEVFYFCNHVKLSVVEDTAIIC